MGWFGKRTWDAGAVKLELTYDFDCAPEAFWALYFDPTFAVSLHRDGLGATSAEVVAQDGDVSSGIRRTLRYGQRPDAPGPVKKLFGEEVVTVEEAVYDPAASVTTFMLTPGTMGDKTDIKGRISVERTDEGCQETFFLEAKVKIFGAGPVVERFIASQARSSQDKAVAFIRAALAS
jgi:Protein of unknown function (DUF2505)